MGDCETPLQQAADAVLQRNALIVTTLDGASCRLLACGCFQMRVLSAAPVCNSLAAQAWQNCAPAPRRARLSEPCSASCVTTSFLSLRSCRRACCCRRSSRPCRLSWPHLAPWVRTYRCSGRDVRASHPVASSAGLLPLPRDFAAPEPPPEQAAAASEGGGGEQRVTRATRRLAPGERATLRRRMAAPPKGFTGREFHKLSNLDGVEFFEEAVVLDLDEAGNATKGAPFVCCLSWLLCAAHCSNSQRPSHSACVTLGTASALPSARGTMARRFFLTASATPITSCPTAASGPSTRTCTMWTICAPRARLRSCPFAS